MWLEETINDLWESGINDDKLSLINKMNEEVQVAVKTPFDLTERIPLEKIVMQGETFGPLCCSVRVDTFGRECLQKNDNLYFYKVKFFECIYKLKKQHTKDSIVQKSKSKAKTLVFDEN